MDSTATARERGTWKYRLVCLVVAGVWLLPACAAAQEDAFTLEADEETRPSDPEAVRELTEVRSEVEIGIGSVSHDSYRFGRYTGLEEQGAFGVLDVEIRRRGSYDGDSARYWHFSGSNLGLTLVLGSADSQIGREATWFNSARRFPDAPWRGTCQDLSGPSWRTPDSRRRLAHL